MAKDLDEKVDQLESAVDPNTVISIGGYSFTPAKLMIAGAIVSSTLGGLYGAFEVYKDYMSMKEAIQTYVTPDLSEINKKIAVLEQNSEKSTEYVRDINTNLKQDIRRLESVVDQVERSAKQSQRETDISVKEVQSELRQTRKELDVAIKDTNSNLDRKIQRALDNPLAGK
jgi:ABC-type transporter Mla subunit MlaD